MTPIKDTDYLAVSAWLHAMETRLLTPEKVERLLEAASETEARKLLTECGYAEALPLEEALREHRETLYKSWRLLCRIQGSLSYSSSNTITIISRRS